MLGPANNRPPLFTNKTTSDCQPALVEQKKRLRETEPLKETNTDTRLMHNVCGRIGTGLQESFAG